MTWRVNDSIFSDLGIHGNGMMNDILENDATKYVLNLSKRTDVVIVDSYFSEQKLHISSFSRKIIHKGYSVMIPFFIREILAEPVIGC